MSSESALRGICLLPGERLQYFDHIIPLSHILSAPIIFHHESDLEIAQKYYPDLQGSFIPYRQVTLDYVKHHFDYFVTSDLVGRSHQHYLRHVHCPHGFSDKLVYLTRLAFEDIALVYGQNMLDQFAELGALSRVYSYVTIGNYRYLYYQLHRAYYQIMVRNEILSHFAKKQPIITYAPTWLDYEDGTTFFDYGDEIIKRLPDHYNMIVKLHPLIHKENAAIFERIVDTYKYKTNLVITDSFLPVYPILEHTDIYLGDSSSLGYDFLRYNRPLFFINKFKRDPSRDRRLYLSRCGTLINPADIPNIYSIIESALKSDQERFSQIRSEINEYSFTPGKSFEEIKQQILDACLSKGPYIK